MIDTDARQLHVSDALQLDVERGIRRLPDGGQRLVLVFVVGEEVKLVLHDRPAGGAADLLIRVRERPCSARDRPRCSALFRKLPTSDPENVLVPDLVMAFTCTPDERPCVASNRFEMNWNSAIASLLYRDWLPVPRFDVTCRPSTLSWNSRTSTRSCTGVAPCAFVRFPGASSASDIQLRPCDGSSVTCRGSMLLPRLDVRGFDERRLRRHRERFGDATGRHLQVDGGRLSDEELHAFARDRVEAGELRRDLVDADAHGECDRRLVDR